MMVIVSMMGQYQKTLMPFLSTFLAMYLLNCSQVISSFPKPATLLTTSLIQSSLRLYLSCSEMRFRSGMSSFYLRSGSTSSNIDRLPYSLKGLPTLSVTNRRKVSKSTHSPARSLVTTSRALKMMLYFLSKPRVRAVLRMSETSHCRLLSQQRLNIWKKSSHWSLEKMGFLVTISLAKTAL